MVRDRDGEPFVHLQGEGVRRARVNELLTLQREDTGWSQTPHLASDAYATGQVLYTLRELGVPAVNATMQRGVSFLLRTQHDDGSWFVKSRAMKIQPYFESGFPYGHDQWISHAGTAWATMGLASAALDERVGSSVSSGLGAESSVGQSARDDSRDATREDSEAPLHPLRP
jgi:hypothetical protein